MTKAVPPRRWLLEKCDGNQEDAHAPGPGARPSKARLLLQQQHSPDWDEDAEPTETRDARRPTSLEELLDLELDLVLPVTAVAAPMSNQAPASAAKEDETVTDTVSLELLAIQSPHGENQQWQSEEDELNAVRSRPEHSPRRHAKEMSAPRKPLPLNLVSPTAFTSSFSPSPRQFSTDDDYGLASPMALPDTPSSQARSGIALAWDLDPPSLTLDDAHTSVTRRFALSKSVQRPERRASASAVATRAATPNPRNHRNCVPDRAASRITRSSLPTLPEVRAKARHGGIYSLLLKNKSTKQEPVLVEDAHNPEVVTAALSVSKASSPPRTSGKAKHGGIYKMLRSSHGPH